MILILMKNEEAREKKWKETKVYMDDIWDLTLSASEDEDIPTLGNW